MTTSSSYVEEFLKLLRLTGQASTDNEWFWSIIRRLEDLHAHMNPYERHMLQELVEEEYK